MTSYTPAHTTADLSGIVIDFIVEYGIQLIAFAGLIALITLATYFRNQF